MILRWLLCGVLLGTSCGVPAFAAAADRPPNFVIIFIDDMGYADIGPFGARGYATPNLDRMASEGRRFTDFYVSQAVCSASRASLMTGCYNVRVGILGALNHTANHGISANEMTLAEVVKQKGYATACFGKWHLGHHPKFLPTSHGFDEYLGLPYSNDMWPFHPEAGGNYPDLPLIEGTRVVDAQVTADDQSQLTTRYTERAVQFIEKNKERPFLVYLPHAMVHVPLHVSEKYRGQSQRGLFGDVVMEIDWSVGQILDTLRKHGLDRDTLVIFTSDNGPWLSYGEHAGSAGPLREGKGTMFDGGCRVPTVMWWPGRIPANSVCRVPAMTIDVLPTIAHLVGAKLPDHKIDGQNIWPLIAGEADARSPQEAYFFYWGNELHAVRMGQWKLHFPHAFRTLGGKPGGVGGRPVSYENGRIELSLFDLDNDIGETQNVAEKHPDVVARIQKLADAMRADLGDARHQAEGPRHSPRGTPQPGRPAFSLEARHAVGYRRELRELRRRIAVRCLQPPFSSYGAAFHRSPPLVHSRGIIPFPPCTQGGHGGVLPFIDITSHPCLPIPVATHPGGAPRATAMGVEAAECGTGMHRQFQRFRPVHHALRSRSGTCQPAGLLLHVPKLRGVGTPTPEHPDRDGIEHDPELELVVWLENSAVDRAFRDLRRVEHPLDEQLLTRAVFRVVEMDVSKTSQQRDRMAAREQL